MHPTEKAYREQIEAEPGNRLTQLILADWYEEQGDPRCELLRVEDSTWEDFLVREILVRWGLPVSDMAKLDLDAGENRHWEDGQYSLEYRHRGRFNLWSNHCRHSLDDPYGNWVASRWSHGPEIEDPSRMPPGWIGHTQPIHK